MRTPVERVLDLGTGCGIQALHAALHSRDVVATDTSARALEFAAFNAAWLAWSSICGSDHCSTGRGPSSLIWSCRTRRL